MNDQPPETETLAATPPVAILIMRLLAVAAMAMSGFLFYMSIQGGAVPGCSPDAGFDCESVLAAGRWSKWFGVPVSAPAVIIYLLIFYDLMRVGAKRSSVNRLQAWGMLFAMASLVAGSAIWFTAVQFLILKKICLYCMIAHGLGIVLSSMIFYFRPRGARVGAMAVVVLLALATLVGSQLLHQPPPTMQRFLLNAKVRLDPDQFPIIGSPHADHVLVYLFDYTCPHCQELNGILKQAMKRYGNQIALIKLPMPLDSKCNRKVTKTADRHLTACDLATLALAVWRAEPDQFPAFDDFLFSASETRPVEEARAQAVRILGKQGLEKALADPWIQEQIEKDIKLYELASEESKARTIPMILGRDFVIVGQPGSPEELFSKLEEFLDIMP